MGGVIFEASFEWGVAVSERGVAVYEEVVSCTAPLIRRSSPVKLAVKATWRVTKHTD